MREKMEGMLPQVPRKPRISSTNEARTVAHVSSGGQNGAGGGRKNVVLLRPKAKGFQPYQNVDVREIQPVVPNFRKQENNFYKFSKQNFSVSEVFFRVPGATNPAVPWKQFGEVTSTTGDFEEAVRAQQYLLYRYITRLSAKARFYLPSLKYTVQFGYANEEGEIVPVLSGPLPEGFAPRELKAMLDRTGFWRKPRPEHWQERGDPNMKRREPGFRGDIRNWNRNSRNNKGDAQADFQVLRKVKALYRFNLYKYKGTYRWFMGPKYKRGMSIGTGPSR